VSLASFPGILWALLPYRAQRRLQRGSLTRQVLRLAWPSVLEQSLITLVGLVDAYIVGHLGREAMAGVGLGGQVLNFVSALFSAVGVGGAALIARSMGAQDPAEANCLARQALVLALALGAALSLIGGLLAEPILRMFGATPEVARAGVLWLQTVAFSFTGLGVLLVGAAVLRGAGDTRTSLLVMIGVNMVNVIVAWTFTHGLFGLPNLGVRGSGLGAMSGHWVGGAIVFVALWRGRGALRLEWQWPALDLTRLRRILNIGLPAGAEQVLLQFAQLSLAVLITDLGTAAYAAHQIGIRVAALAFLPGWGFSVAATTLVGQALGAQRPDLARRATYIAYAFALGIMVSMGLLLFFAAEPILWLFTSDPEVARAGLIVARTDGLLQAIIATSFVFSGALRGAGDTRSTMAITVTSIWFVRLSACYLLAHTLGLGLQGIWLGIGLDFAARAAFFFWRFRTGRWAKIRV
jgi:putative MATE family efflux protein